MSTPNVVNDRSNSVMLGMYTTEQSFTDAGGGYLDLSSDANTTVNNNFKFGGQGRLQSNGGSQY